MRKQLLLMLLLSISMYVNAQVYTFDNDGGAGDGTWSTAANWDPGLPPNPLPSGSSIIIAANCTQNLNRTIASGASLTVNSGIILTRDFNLTIQGTMTIVGKLVNNSTLTISAGGLLTNNGTIDHGNGAGDNINNAGTIDNNGSINLLFGTVNNQATGVFQNNTMGVIVISAGATLTNQNQMTNAGTILNHGTLRAATADPDVFTNAATGMIENQGALIVQSMLDNNGSIMNYVSITVSSDGTFNNLATGNLTNQLSGTISNNNIFNNGGILTNHGTLNAASGSNDLFNNTGTLVNNLIISIGAGNLLNSNTGTLTNNNGGSLTVNNSGTLTNDGLLDNYGLLTNNNNFNNSGIVTNYNGAVINNGNGNGDQLINTGTLNNNTGAIINNYEGSIVNTINGTFNNNGTYTGYAPLPIELIYFLGKQVNNTIVLKWQTATEKENAYMAVERSRDGIHFMEIGRRKGAGTTVVAQTYDLTDAAPLYGINYYRLRQVDLDEKVTYHSVVAVIFDDKTQTKIQLYPSLAAQEMTLILATPATSLGTVQILDATGKEWHRQMLSPQTLQETIPVHDLPTGTYFLSVFTENAFHTLRFVKI